MNSEKQIHGRHFDHPGKPRGFGQGGKRRGDKGALTALTRNAMFAEWNKLSPNLDIDPLDHLSEEGIVQAFGKLDMEKAARIIWTCQALQRSVLWVTTWNQLTEAQGRFLLKRMREESGDGPAYRARLIARLAQELFGSAWDRLLADRLRARFQKSRAEDLTPREAHSEIEELLSRIARRDGCGIEEVRRKKRTANLQPELIAG